jgi:hypothetical protein
VEKRAEDVVDDHLGKQTSEVFLDLRMILIH